METCDQIVIAIDGDWVHQTQLLDAFCYFPDLGLLWVSQSESTPDLFDGNVDDFNLFCRLHQSHRPYP